MCESRSDYDDLRNGKNLGRRGAVGLSWTRTDFSAGAYAVLHREGAVKSDGRRAMKP